jgi:manganese/zinc/iron transport system substrate-binding protein
MLNGMGRKTAWALIALPLGAIVACSPPEPPPRDGTLRVVATTGMIAENARRIAGPRAEVIALMGPGVDPHLFKASAGDVRRLGDAHLVLYNGLLLEGKMGDVLSRLARTRPVVAVAESIPEEELLVPPELEGLYDPHLWFDVRLWARTLDPIVEALCDLVPEHADEFLRRGEAWRQELVELDRWVEARIGEIPPERRVLVTAHDAFGYFGRRYDIEVVGLQGISTLAEAGLQDMERVVHLVTSRRIPAIFIETSVPSRSIEAVQAAAARRGHQVAIGGELFSDAMGAPGTPEGTYPGMVRHNVDTIVEALKR